MSTTIYDSFINTNVAPYSADAIGVFNSNGELVKRILIDGFKPSYTDRLFRFGILSDVHNNNADSQSTEDIADLTNALSVLNSIESVNMTCICGDITQGGRPAQFIVYRDTVAANSPNTPVYTTTGNHDCPSSGGLVSTDWEPYTGNPMTFEIIKEIGGKNVPFLFLGMNLYSLGDSGTPYLDTDIDWLEEKLEEYRNERVFVITHLFFPTKAGNFKQIYPSTNWLGGTQLERLQAMNERYLNSIWFSGHSHWKWYLQKYEDKANVYRSYDDNGNPTCGWTVHVPSCASPIDSDGVSSRVSMALASEGGIVDVYDDYIVLRGVVFKKESDTGYTNKYEPIAQYKLDTTLIEIPALETDEPADPDAPVENYVRAEHFDLNTAKANGDLALITDLPDNYVQLTFTQGNQSYWIRSDSWSADATSCMIELEDLIVEDANGNVITKPDYVGFYNRNHSQKVDQYRIVDNEEIVITESGSNKRAQFGSSSSYNYGTCRIKMKFKLKYTV
jgi:hypothetical protein